MQNPTNLHLQRHLTLRYYSFHRHVLVTLMTTLRVSYSNNTSDTPVIAQKQTWRFFLRIFYVMTGVFFVFLLYDTLRKTTRMTEMCRWNVEHLWKCAENGLTWSRLVPNERVLASLRKFLFRESRKFFSGAEFAVNTKLWENWTICYMIFAWSSSVCSHTLSKYMKM